MDPVYDADYYRNLMHKWKMIAEIQGMIVANIIGTAIGVSIALWVLK